MKKNTKDIYRNNEVRDYNIKKTNEAMRKKDATRFQRFKWPIVFVMFMAFLTFAAFEARRVQIFGEDVYAITALNQVMNRHGSDDRVVLPNRGGIMDRHFQPLALSSMTFDIFVDARRLRSRGENELANNRRIFLEFFGWSEGQFNDMLARDTHHLIIYNGVPYSVRSDFDAWMDEQTFGTRDIHFNELSQRSYIHNHLAAPILGFQRDLWWGLEHQYNQFLTGHAGRNMTVFTDGHVVTQRIPASNGANVVTTLDLNMQRFAEDLAERWAQDAQAAHGSVIVMRPQNGEIFAMAQYPSFNANDPAAQTERTAELDIDSDEFLDELFRTWANFNVSSTFEPGSTYKSITAAKALDIGVIGTNQMFYCHGFTYRAGHRIRCWIYPRRHGQINLTEAIAHSCNMAHIDIAEAIGRDAFWQYQRDFGFGSQTGIDLPGENAGVVFAPHELNASELATSSFGQRFTVTPIQAISSFAPLINGGNIVRPHIVSHINDQNNHTIFTQNTDIQRRIIAPDVSDWMRRAMAYTTTIGTARTAAIEGFTQGGKTATGEQGLQEDENFTWSISYIGYFPVENPQYLVMVLLHEIPTEVYNGGFRSVVPMYREMMNEIIRLRNMPPCTSVESPGTLSESDFVDNFVGMSVQQAIDVLNAIGQEYSFVGSGNVVASQFPPPSARRAGDITVSLYLTDNGSEPLFAVPDIIGQPAELAREVLRNAGFVPRVVYSDHDAPYGSSPIIYEQVGRGLSLPQNTDILIRAQ
ncbi:MAG: penicillin-binding transpeptidase domain-containing protein [Defluviitaleaceae bacterium]|nr:penicillin-binding transpeptidase domain-containing protein [Defluviitaleaceae bacterium]